MNKYLYILIFILIFRANSFTQIQNTLHEINTDTSFQTNSLNFQLYSNSFLKNNEYFGDAHSGYTLIGSQNILSLNYKPFDYMTIQGGVYAKKISGIKGLDEVEPYFQLKLEKEGYSLIMGNLNGNINHRMIEPMYAYESLLSNFLENGIQAKLDKKIIYSDLWVNWRKYQKPYANFNEEFTFGNHTRLKLKEDEKNKLIIPIQMVINHSGGQWDTSNQPIVSLFNLALGFDYTRQIESPLINSIGLSGYFLHYKDWDHNSGLPVSDGQGIYTNLNLKFKSNFYATLSYYHSKDFISPSGFGLYQSLSINPIKPNEVKLNRELLLLTLAYQKRLSTNFGIDIRTEPFYDFGDNRMDYSYTIIMTFQPNFLLKKF